MNRRLAHLLTRMYPRPWRERYGEEFEDLLREGRGDLKAYADVIRSAVGEHIHPTNIGPTRIDPAQGGMMSEVQSSSFANVVRQPSALVPLGMAMTALAVVMIHIAIYGAAREADEGPTAHIWQLLMVAQLPALLVFGIRWLPKAPRQAIAVMGLLAVAILAAMAPVFIFHL